jgi:hypothetical protein
MYLKAERGRHQADETFRLSSPLAHSSHGMRHRIAPQWPSVFRSEVRQELRVLRAGQGVGEMRVLSARDVTSGLGAVLQVLLDTALMSIALMSILVTIVGDILAP